MKLRAKHLNCGYLYGDGCLVALYRKWDATYQLYLEWAEIHEAYALPGGFTGRIVLHASLVGLLPVLRGASVHMQAADVSHGSKKTKEQGLPVDGIDWLTKDGLLGEISGIPGLLSTGYTIQPDAEGSFAEFAQESRWSDHPVTKVHRAKSAVA